MSQFVRTAQSLFRRHPFLANSTIYGCLYVGAEYTQQFVSKKLLAESKAEEIDYAIVGRYAVMGTVVYAPTLYTWYKWLDRTFPGTAKTVIVKKLILDQFVLTPYLLTVFYAGMALMERADDPLLELREKFIPTFVRSCGFWLPAQTLNFVLVAPKFRVIYMGVCGFIWVNILCWLKRQQIAEAPMAIDVDNDK